MNSTTYLDNTRGRKIGELYTNRGINSGKCLPGAVWNKIKWMDPAELLFGVRHINGIGQGRLKRIRDKICSDGWIDRRSGNNLRRKCEIKLVYDSNH